EPAGRASPRFSPSRPPVPPPTSSAEALPLFSPPLTQSTLVPHSPGFSPEATSSFRQPSRAALEFVAAQSLPRSPPPLAPVAPRPIPERTTLWHPYKGPPSRAPR